MLSWLVIPLVGLWALSGLLLPPRLRVEVTSPHLACVLVLLTTLFWYEIIVPRPVARPPLRPPPRAPPLPAIELQNLSKTATRRCHNFLSPYDDQNPGEAGRFMCGNCGHVSKRPILDLPGGTTVAGRNGWFCN